MHERYKLIERLVRSVEGMFLAVRATNAGRPALCGVDPLIRQELGDDYRRDNHGTMYAGVAVAHLMRELGYVEAGIAKCPLGCIAGGGTLWKPKAL